jgi:hypothetical protein
MEIEYSLIEDDMFALAKCRLSYMPALRQRQERLRMGYTLGLSVLAVLAWALLPDKIIAFALAAVAIVVFSLFPSYQQYRLRQIVTSAYRDEEKRKRLSKTSLTASADGLLEKSAMGNSLFLWNKLDKVVVTPTHAFISVDHSFTIVIPKNRTTLGNYDDFIQAMNSFMTADKAH